MLGVTRKGGETIVRHYLTSLTLNVKVDPLTDSGRDVVTCYAEVGSHVLPPHPRYLQSLPGPHLHHPVLRGHYPVS